MSAALEAKLGMAGYATSTPPIAGRLKLDASDFLVEELGPSPLETSTGTWTAAWIRLTNWETNRFVRIASDRLGISRGRIQFSGTKDKRGQTLRWFTIRARPEAVEDLSGLEGVQVVSMHRTDRARRLGDHEGNRFRLRVRDLDAAPQDALASIEECTRQLQAAGGFPNFFGVQRFGSAHATTHLVGRAIVGGQFQAAIDAYVATPYEQDAPELAAAREQYRKDHDAQALLAHFVGTHADFERTLLQSLLEQPDDPVRALMRLPENLQRMFVSAHQSFLFNRILSARLAENLPLGAPLAGDLLAIVEHGNPGHEWLSVDEANQGRAQIETQRGRVAPTAPLPGANTRMATGRPGQIEMRVLKEEAVETTDFIVPEIPHVSTMGTRRPMTVRVPKLSAKAGTDARGDYLELVFDLPKGVYATSLIRELLKPQDLAAYG